MRTIAEIEKRESPGRASGPFTQATLGTSIGAMVLGTNRWWAFDCPHQLRVRREGDDRGRALVTLLAIKSGTPRFPHAGCAIEPPPAAGTHSRAFDGDVIPYLRDFPVREPEVGGLLRRELFELLQVSAQNKAGQNQTDTIVRVVRS